MNTYARPRRHGAGLQSVSINHTALRFIFPQPHSGAQLDSFCFLVFLCKCRSRVHASRQSHAEDLGASVTLTPLEFSQTDSRMNSVGVLSKYKQIK